MKKAQLVENVTAWTKDNDMADVDEQQLAIDLMKAGASMSMVNNMLSKTLVKLGLKDDPSLARKEAEAEVKNAIGHMWDEVPEWDHADVQDFLGDMECGMDAALKALKKLAKAMDVKLPTKPKLGKVKTGVVDYFTATSPADCSIKGLAQYLFDNNCCNATKTESEEEACLRASRMNFTFAQQLLRAGAESN